MGNRMEAISKPSNNRVAWFHYNRADRFGNFSIIFKIKRIETRFWCPYLCCQAWENKWKQFETVRYKWVARFHITDLQIFHNFRNKHNRKIILVSLFMFLGATNRLVLIACSGPIKANNEGNVHQKWGLQTKRTAGLVVDFKLK